jgi:hypothetical protein
MLVHEVNAHVMCVWERMKFEDQEERFEFKLIRARGCKRARRESQTASQAAHLEYTCTSKPSRTYMMRKLKPSSASVCASHG